MWFECTDNAGETIYVNLANAIKMEQSGESTLIYFPGAKSELVQQKARDLFAEAKATAAAKSR